MFSLDLKLEKDSFGDNKPNVDAIRLIFGNHFFSSYFFFFIICSSCLLSDHFDSWTVDYLTH